jgi:two-component system chemotaxis response regulator CheB
VRIALDGSPLVRGVRPSLDVTLRSAADAFGARATAVVLTGMGRDGAVGCGVVRAGGGTVIVQTPASCVVAGMPQAALAESGADTIADPADLAAAVMRTVDTARAL